MLKVVFEPHKSRPLSDFHAELSFEFPDIPTQLFDYYLIKAARQMANEGKLIRRRVVIEATQNITRYRLEAPDGLDICGILDIRRSPTCTCLQTIVARSFVPPAGALSCGRDIAWYEDGVINIRPPFCSGAYYVTVAVSPSQDTCTLPDNFFTDYLDTLLLGAKSYILAITGRPWTNLALANAYAKRFASSLKSDTIDTATHNMRGSIRMRFGDVL